MREEVGVACVSSEVEEGLEWAIIVNKIRRRLSNGALIP